MKKTADKVYDISCNWYSETQDASGSTGSSWAGKILVFEDNACIGYAIDKGHEQPTHLLAGTYVDGKGLSICKIHGTKTVYDPIFFDAFVNDNGEKDTYYGQFLASTPFNLYPLGNASVTTKERNKDEKECNNIQSVYDGFAENIKSKTSHNAYILAYVSVLDIEDMSRKIEFVADSTCKDELPKIFDNKSGSQPGSED